MGVAPVVHSNKGCVCCIGWDHWLHRYPHVVVIHPPLVLRRIAVERIEHGTVGTHHRLWSWSYEGRERG